MPEEKSLMNENVSGASGSNEGLDKDKISESILARAKRSVKNNFLSTPGQTLKKSLKESRQDGFDNRKKLYNSGKSSGDFSSLKDNNSQIDGIDQASNDTSFSMEGEKQKQESQRLELGKRKGVIKENKEKVFLSRRPSALARETASFQANKNMILQEGLGEIKGRPNSLDKEEGVDNNVADGSPNSERNKDSQLESSLNADKQKDKKSQAVAGEISQASYSGISGIRLSTDGFLKKAWELALASFTLSMFYVYIHVFLHQILPKHFGELGQEWVPLEIKKSDSGKAQEIGKKIGIIEKPGVGCCCIFHLVVTILICAVIYFVINWDEVAWLWLESLFSKSDK